MAACPFDSQDSRYELVKKILLQFISMATQTVPDCLQPQTNDSEFDLWAKILQSMALL